MEKRNSALPAGMEEAFATLTEFGAMPMDCFTPW